MPIIDICLLASGLTILFWVLKIHHQDQLPKHPLKQLFWPLLFTKALSALFFTFYYHQKTEYVSDLDTHFDDLTNLSNTLFSQPILFFQYFFGLETPNENLIWTPCHDPRSFNFIRMTFPIFLLSGRNIYALNLISSVFSTLFLFQFACQFYKTFPKHLPGIILGLLFLPTMLFWCSAFTKETYAYAFLCYILFFLLKNERTRNEIIFAALSFLLLLSIKPIFAPLLVPFLYLFLTQKLEAKKIRLFNLASLFFGAVFGLWLAKKLWIYVVISYQINYASPIHVESSKWLVNKYDHFTTDVLTAIPNSFKALSGALARPSFVESHNIFQWLEAFQNQFFLFFLLLWVANKLFFGWKPNAFKFILLVVCLFFCFFVSFSFSSIGTISRFKVIFLPWLIWLIFEENLLFFLSKSNVEKLSQKLRAKP